MRVVHDPANGEPADEGFANEGLADEESVNETSTLATRVEFADSIWKQGIGLMFRRSVPDDYALVFRFGRVGRRSLHMLFVPFDIDAVWLEDGAVTKVKRLRAWRGHGSGRGDTIIELPVGATEGVEVGDRVRIDGE